MAVESLRFERNTCVGSWGGFENIGCLLARAKQSCAVGHATTPTSPSAMPCAVGSGSLVQVWPSSLVAKMSPCAEVDPALPFPSDTRPDTQQSEVVGHETHVNFPGL